jgi:bacterioferritin (cytochrome b1)
VIWLAAIRQYRAYARLPGARRDTTLTASTPADMAARISHAEQAARLPAKDRA